MTETFIPLKTITYTAEEIGYTFATVNEPNPTIPEQGVWQMGVMAAKRRRFIQPETLKVDGPHVEVDWIQAPRGLRVKHWLRHLRPHPGFTTTWYHYRASAITWPLEVQGHTPPPGRTSVQAMMLGGFDD